MSGWNVLRKVVRRKEVPASLEFVVISWCVPDLRQAGASKSSDGTDVEDAELTKMVETVDEATTLLIVCLQGRSEFDPVYRRFAAQLDKNTASSDGFKELFKSSCGSSSVRGYTRQSLKPHFSRQMVISASLQHTHTTAFKICLAETCLAFVGVSCDRASEISDSIELILGKLGTEEADMSSVVDHCIVAGRFPTIFDLSDKSTSHAYAVCSAKKPRGRRFSLTSKQKKVKQRMNLLAQLSRHDSLSLLMQWECLANFTEFGTMMDPTPHHDEEAYGEDERPGFQNRIFFYRKDGYESGARGASRFIDADVPKSRYLTVDVSESRIHKPVVTAGYMSIASTNPLLKLTPEEIQRSLPRLRLQQLTVSFRDNMYNRAYIQIYPVFCAPFIENSGSQYLRSEASEPGIHRVKWNAGQLYEELIFVNDEKFSTVQRRVRKHLSLEIRIMQINSPKDQLLGSIHVPLSGLLLYHAHTTSFSSRLCAAGVAYGTVKGRISLCVGSESMPSDDEDAPTSEAAASIYTLGKTAFAGSQAKRQQAVRRRGSMFNRLFRRKRGDRRRLMNLRIKVSGAGEPITSGDYFYNPENLHAKEHPCYENAQSPAIIRVLAIAGKYHWVIQSSSTASRPLYSAPFCAMIPPTRGWVQIGTAAAPTPRLRLKHRKKNQANHDTPAALTNKASGKSPGTARLGDEEQLEQGHEKGGPEFDLDSYANDNDTVGGGRAVAIAGSNSDSDDSVDSDDEDDDFGISDALMRTLTPATTTSTTSQPTGEVALDLAEEPESDIEHLSLYFAATAGDNKLTSFLQRKRKFAMGAKSFGDRSPAAADEWQCRVAMKARRQPWKIAVQLGKPASDIASTALRGSSFDRTSSVTVSQAEVVQQAVAAHQLKLLSCRNVGGEFKVTQKD